MTTFSVDEDFAGKIFHISITGKIGQSVPPSKLFHYTISTVVESPHIQYIHYWSNNGRLTLMTKALIKAAGRRSLYLLVTKQPPTIVAALLAKVNYNTVRDKPRKESTKYTDRHRSRKHIYKIPLLSSSVLLYLEEEENGISKPEECNVNGLR